MAKNVLDFGGGMPAEITHSHLCKLPGKSPERIDNFSGKRVKSHPTLDVDIVEKTRETVYNAVETVLSDGKLDKSYIRYYQMVENLCRYKHVEQTKLSTVLYDTISQKYQQEVKVQLSNSLELSNEIEAVASFLKMFEQYNQKLTLLTKIFLYIDRCYLLHHRSKKPIRNYGLQLFTDDFFTGIPCEKLLRLHKTILNQARLLEDEDKVSNAQRLSTLLLSLNDDSKLKLHHDLINQIILNYSEIRSSWDEPQTYFTTILHKISYEITFWKQCGYSKSFLHDLLLKLKWNLIFYNFQNIISDTLPYIIQSEQELSVLIKYCRSSEEEFNYNSLKVFANIWGSYLCEIFNKTIENLKQSSQKNVISSIIDLYLKYKQLTELKFSFQKDCQFEYEFRFAFNQMINQPEFNSFIVQLLIKQCDGYFKQKLDINFDKLTLQTSIIFKAINNKDDYIIQYQRDLSRRLLLNKGYDINEERKMVDLLLNTIGDNDISISLNHMFQDLQISQEYRMVSENVEFIPLILEKKHWPDIPKMDNSQINLPPLLQTCLNRFLTSYQNFDSKNSNKLLDWTNYGLHQITIEVEFKSGVKELILNLYQAIVILIFENQDSFTWGEIINVTELDEVLLRRILNSFIKSKVMVMVGDVYHFNYNLADKSPSLKISLGKDVVKEKVIPKQTIIRNRNDEIKAAIIKIIKHSRKLSMIELLNQCFKMLESKGPVSIINLKSNIENLIDNEYIKRSDKDVLEYIP